MTETAEESGRRSEMKANTATANIVAEMRDRAKRPDFIAPGVLRDFADRIEVTWKREIAEVEASALDVGGVVEASRHTGNAAAMREAFKKLDKELSFCERNVELGIGFALEGLREHCRIVREILKTALALPPRNCDVGTAEEQVRRFCKYCDSEICKRKWCKSRAKALCIEKCALSWSQMSYGDGGAEH